MRRTIATLLIVLLLTQAGCAVSSGRPPYPPEWASIKSVPTHDGCPNLQGTYSNQGSATFPPEAGAPPSLAEVFTRLAQGQGPTSPAAWKKLWPAIPLDAESLVIDRIPETMTVTFIAPDGNRTPLNFRRYRFRLTEDRVDDLFSCRTLYGEPILTLFASPESSSSVSPIVVGGGGTTVILLKSVDGSLVVNWRSDSATLTLFVLGSGYRVDNLWYRYPLLTADEPVHR